MLLVALLGGCSSVPADKGFGRVHQTIGERTGVEVRWDRNTPEDRAARSAVDRLLANELTTDAAVQVALLNNPRLQAAYEELGVAQADLVQAGLLKNPVFSGEIRFPRDPVSPLELDVFFDFITLLQMPMRQQAARAGVEAAQYRAIAAALDLSADTREAFYAVQGAEQMLEMRRGVSDATEASAAAAREFRRAGNVTDLMLQGEESLAAQARLDLAMAQADLVPARERLNVLMGLWGQQTQWKISGRLPDPPALEVQGHGLESLAIAQRPDLQAAAADVRSRAGSLGLAKQFALIPQATVGSHFEREPDGVKTVGPSIEIPIPLFDNGQADIARADAVLWQNYRRHEAMAIEARSQVRMAYAKVVATRGRAEYYRQRVLPLQQQILDLTQRQYNAMQFGVFQLLQAKQSQIDAGRAYIDTLRDYWMARAELEKAVGGKLPHDAAPATGAATQPATTAPAPEEEEREMHEHHH